MELQFSAPGKIILFGEHAVVYGYPAIAASINLRMYLTLSELVDLPGNSDTGYIISFPDVHTSPISIKTLDLQKLRELYLDIDGNAFVQTVLSQSQAIVGTQETSRARESMACFLLIDALVCKLCSKHKQHTTSTLHSFSISSELPISAGLGSSAAFCTVVAASLLFVHRQLDLSNIKLSMVQSIAHEAERIMHASPSGVDTTISTFGGLIYFQRDAKSQQVTCDQMPQHPSDNNHQKIIIIDTGIPRSTSTAVKQVAEFKFTRPAAAQRIFTEINAIVQSAKCHLVSTIECDSPVLSSDSLQHLVEENQRLLVELGVSHPVINALVKFLGDMGISGKITGAGQGGCVLALPNGDIGDLEAKLSHYNVRIIRTEFCVPGLSVQVIR